jgi:hypothetical protein
MDLMQMLQLGVKCWVLVNVLKNLRVPQSTVNLWNI